MYDRKFVQAVTLLPKLPVARRGSGFRGQSSFPERHQNSNFGYLARSQSAQFRSFLCTFFLGCIKHIRAHVQFVYFSVIKCSSSSLPSTLPFFPFRIVFLFRSSLYVTVLSFPHRVVLRLFSFYYYCAVFFFPPTSVSTWGVFDVLNYSLVSVFSCPYLFIFLPLPGLGSL